ncbi:hypothetical protein ACFPYI_03235 [Halomarina salina]|uniref:Uncharacterized protein n=1 Tax=Halomarina salina TaxID=1872699 RepID=A0ABD5RIV9_9EURY|nr:hypothetical protein [Halomarina salina]
MDESLHRRSLLAGLGAGVATALAGCAALGDASDSGPEPYRIGGISIINRDDAVHALGLRIERDEELVLDETFDLPANSPGDVTAVTEVAAASFDGCTAGSYGITAALDDTDRRLLEAPDECEVRTNAWRTLLVEDDGALRWGVTTVSDDDANCRTPTPSGGLES